VTSYLPYIQRANVKLRTHDAQTDSWAGFTKEKETLLNALQSVPNVVMLSGDRHEAAVIEFAAPTNASHKIFEISTSPLSMFYIPFVRTLKSVSEETIRRVRHVVTQDVDEEGNEVISTVEEAEEIPRERVLNYTPIGNYKWSAIEIDTLDLDHPKARLELVADGKVAYKSVLPVWLSTSIY
jgi:alkaline phosphatase D